MSLTCQDERLRAWRKKFPSAQTTAWARDLVSPETRDVKSQTPAAAAWWLLGGRGNPHKDGQSAGKSLLSSETQIRVSPGQLLQGSPHTQHVCPLQEASPGPALAHMGIQPTGEQAQEEKVSGC